MSINESKRLERGFSKKKKNDGFEMVENRHRKRKLRKEEDSGKLE